MAQRHFLSLKDWSREEIELLFELAAAIKAEPNNYASALAGQSLAMVFQKPSTRTRVSFEVGMYQLGGQALFLGANDIQLHRGETIADTARVLSRYVQGIMARVFAHQDVLDLARHGSVPVINGLSDLLHPCQALADYFTLRERRGDLGGLKMAYVGDGNNVCHELMFGALKLGMRMSMGCPRNYAPNPLILKSAEREARKLGSPVPVVTPDPMQAVVGADVVYTDVWTSMGQEAENARAPGRVPRVHGHAGDDGDGRPAGRLHALPARPPRGRGVGRGDRRAAVGRVRRGREPAARAEGRARHADGRAGPGPRLRRTADGVRPSRGSRPAITRSARVISPRSTSSRIDTAPIAVGSTKGTRPARAFLSRASAARMCRGIEIRHGGARADVVDRGGDLVPLRLVEHPAAVRDPGGPDQTPADGLAVGEAPVVRDGLERVADRVAEVEHAPQARPRARPSRRRRP